MAPDFPSVVLETVRREHLVPGGATVVVGVSGGPDSMALLRCLVELRPELGCRLVAAHLDHALRPASPEDLAFCRDWAEKWEVPFRSERLDPERLRRGGGNLEARSREARYEFLARIASETAGIVAVGHHAGDRAETFLAQLVRGSGTRGLSLPRYRREDGVIRPLLDRTREEILSFLQRRRIPFRTDPTNLDGSNLRSRIRRDVLPLLERENPDVVRAIGRASRILTEVDSVIEELARTARSELTVAEAPGELCLDGPQGRPYHRIVLSSVLRQALRRVGAGSAEIGFEPLERSARAWKDGHELALDLPGDIRLLVGPERVVVARATRPSGFREREVPIPGRVLWSEGEAESGGRPVHLITERVEPPPVDPGRVSGPRHAWVDAARVVSPLRIRSRLPGDRYRPLGLEGSVKIQDLFVDRKIPRLLRDSLPLVVDGEGILWIPGFRVNHRIRITEDTKTALRLEITGDLPMAEESAG